MKLLTIAAALMLATTLATSAQTKVSETKITKTTYPYSDPDPVAKPQSAIYPYFRFDGYTSVPRQNEWKVVELENDYIKLTIYPEIGGKIWGAVEKKSGNNFIYDNSVVKFREIAMRGAWTSGGIEMNFGIIGHSPATSSPVDYKIRTNDDGSVSCFVGTLDLLTHTWWNVEVRLEPDKAYFETATYWHNPQPLIAPLYHWMTGGYPISDGLEFSFPGSYYVEHSGLTDSWIKNAQGRDISWYKNNDFGGPKSYHVAGALADYFAGYYHDKGWGSVHSSPTGEKLGMKVWIWGLSREGMIWEDLLTDTDGQYTEWQSGRLYNQEGGDSYLTPFKHLGFTPSSSEEYNELWYPTLDTRGVVASNRYGTLNYTYENGSYTIYFSPLQMMTEKLTVSCDGREILSEDISVKPLELWSKTVAAPKGEVKIELGAGLLTYSSKAEITSRPTKTPADFDWNSLYGHYTKGRQMIYARQYKTAEVELEQALKIDPNYAPALTDMATLKYRRGYMDEARKLAAKALSMNTYDAEANLIFAASSAAMGETVDAIDGYTVAALSATHRAAGIVGAAKSCATRKDWHRVIHYAEKALDCGFNPEAYQLLSVACRNLGKQDKALTALTALEQKMPLNHFVTTEKIFAGVTSEKSLAESVRCELPNEIFIELGLWYESIGATADALKIYEIVPFHPLIAYRQAYLTGNKSYIEKAEAASPDFVFPSRVEFLQPLQLAALQSENWKTKYYLALLQVNLNHKTTEAVATLEALADKPEYAPFYLTRALLTTPDKVLQNLKRAEQLDKSWRVGVALANEYRRLAEPVAMLKTATEYRTLFPANEKIAIGYIEALTVNKRYTDALKEMRKVNLLPFEGSTLGRTMFREANLALAIDALKARKYSQALKFINDSEEWIENLGVGKPYDVDIDTRSEDYLRSLVYKAQGDKAKCEAILRKIASEIEPLNSNTIMAALALREVGKEEDARELISRYQSTHHNRNVARWSKAIFEGDKALAQKIVREGGMTTSGSPFGTNYRDYGYIKMVLEIVEL